MEILEQIKKSLGVGKVRKNSKNTPPLFRVDKRQEGKMVIYLFNKYPLISANYTYFLLLEQCYNLIKQKVSAACKAFETWGYFVTPGAIKPGWICKNLIFKI